MAGEVNLQKLKEVAKYFFKNIDNNNLGYYSPIAIKRVHEFLNDAPDIVNKEELPYMTGINIDKEWE